MIIIIIYIFQGTKQSIGVNLQYAGGMKSVILDPTLRAHRNTLRSYFPVIPPIKVYS